jgi:hypothetical protein
MPRRGRHRGRRPVPATSRPRSPHPRCCRAQPGDRLPSPHSLRRLRARAGEARRGPGGAGVSAGGTLGHYPENDRSCRTLQLMLTTAANWRKQRWCAPRCSQRVSRRQGPFDGRFGRMGRMKPPCHRVATAGIVAAVMDQVRRIRRGGLEHRGVQQVDRLLLAGAWRPVTRQTGSRAAARGPTGAVLRAQ